MGRTCVFLYICGAVDHFGMDSSARFVFERSINHLHMKSCFHWLLAGICLLVMASCEKEPQPVKVTGVSVNPTTLSLTEGDTADLTATVSPSNADNPSVTWDSNDKSVATVSNGKVTAVKAGSAVIFVRTVDGGFTASCTVTVVAKVIDVGSVSLSKTEVTLTEGDSETVTATVKPDDATDKTVTWTSSDNAVATVDGGKITAVKEGEATITAKAGDKTATCKVTVEKKVIAVESVELDKAELELTDGESAALVATVKPDDATDKAVTWSSSDPEVATVEDGVVTAIKEGTATITVSAGEKCATCAVTVKAKEHPLASLFGDYSFSSVILAEDEEEGGVLMYGVWDMKISPYEGNTSRIWIDKVTIFQAPDVYGKFLSEGDVYAEVSEDLKTITIPVPQTVKSTAEAFDEDEPFVLYKFAENMVDAVTSEGVITFTLQEDGSWKTGDNYGFSTKSNSANGLYYYYMNCFGGYNPDYPTVFVKKEASTQSKMGPSRKVSAKKLSTHRSLVIN